MHLPWVDAGALSQIYLAIERENPNVVIQLGDVKVVDMMSYMKALSKFKKGETTHVKVLRDKTEIEREITF